MYVFCVCAHLVVMVCEHLLSATLDPIPQSAWNQLALKFAVVIPKRTKHADGHSMIISSTYLQIIMKLS